MKIIAGLGNPGDKYKLTRHNVGFIVTAKLASKYGIQGKFESKFNSVIGKGIISGQEIMIVQPMTYMNLSGEAISKVLSFYKVEPKNLLVVFDDISIDLGRIRFRPSGSDGGHNGIKSIINCLGGSNDFPRLKVGIGPQPPMMPSEAYVLQKFNEEQQEVLDKVVKLSVDAIECYLSEGLEKARNKFNGVNVS